MNKRDHLLTHRVTHPLNHTPTSCSLTDLQLQPPTDPSYHQLTDQSPMHWPIMCPPLGDAQPHNPLLPITCLSSHPLTDQCIDPSPYLLMEPIMWSYHWHHFTNHLFTNWPANTHTHSLTNHPCIDQSRYLLIHLENHHPLTHITHQWPTIPHIPWPITCPPTNLHRYLPTDPSSHPITDMQSLIH